MQIDKDYLASLHNLINLTPWRCNDLHLKDLLDITETLIWEHEELNIKYSEELSRHINHAEMLKGQLMESMLDNEQLKAKYECGSTMLRDIALGS
jgi:hypothetical protein